MCVCVSTLFSYLVQLRVKQEMLATYDMGSFVTHMDRSAICRTCTRPYMIFRYTYVNVIVGRAYYYQVRSRLFLCIVNKCAKGLHFSAFIILWLIHVHVHVCLYTLYMYVGTVSPFILFSLPLPLTLLTLDYVGV